MFAIQCSTRRQRAMAHKALPHSITRMNSLSRSDPSAGVRLQRDRIVFSAAALAAPIWIAGFFFDAKRADISEAFSVWTWKDGGVWFGHAMQTDRQQPSYKVAHSTPTLSACRIIMLAGGLLYSIMRNIYSSIPSYKWKLRILMLSKRIQQLYPAIPVPVVCVREEAHHCCLFLRHLSS